MSMKSLNQKFLQYKLISYQCIEGLAAYQGKDQPQEPVPTVEPTE